MIRACFLHSYEVMRRRHTPCTAASFTGLAALALGLFVTAATTGCGIDDGLYGDVDRSTYAATLPSAVERWRKLVEKYLKKQHVTWGLNIIKCESGGNPNAYNSSSGASGLFQHLKRYWADRASKAGFAGASAFDPEANIAASAWLLYAKGGGPGHWSCKFSPFENWSYVPQFYNNGTPVGPGGGGTTPPPADACKTLGASGGIISEEGDCFEMHGDSKYWRSVSGAGYGGGLLWTNAWKTPTASNWAKWRVKISQAGKYRVSYYRVGAYAVFNRTRYVIRANGANKTYYVDQSQGGDGWRTIAELTFAAGGDQYVAVHDDSPTAVPKDQHIVADAIKVELVTPPPSNPTPPPSNPTPPPSNPTPPPSNPTPPPNGDTGDPTPPAPNDPGTNPAPPSLVPPQPAPPPQNPRNRVGVQGGCSAGGSGAAQASWPLLALLALGLLTTRRRRLS